MADYDNTNHGAAFKNKKKTNENQPGYKGKIDVEGKEYWISVWVKTAGPQSKMPGEKFLSMALTPVEDNNTREQSARNQTNFDDFDDDIPF